MLNKIRKHAFDDREDFTDEDIKKIVKQDYEDLIDLRQRIKYDQPFNAYEEDPITLDHILDYVEIILKELE